LVGVHRLWHRKGKAGMRLFKPNVKKLERKRDVRRLVKALNDPERGTRIQAAAALGRIGDPLAFGPLIAAMGDPDKGIHLQAGLALGDIGKPAADSLIAALGDKTPQIRWSAAGLLGEIGEVRAVEPLISSLTDQVPEVRACAARSLGNLGDSRAIAPLAALASDPRPDVRRIAVEALTGFGAQAVPLLDQSLSSGEEHAKEGVAEALSQMGEVGIAALIAALKHKDMAVRRAAAKGLAVSRSPDAVTGLVFVLGDEHAEVGKAAVASLVQIGAPGLPAILRALTNDNERAAANAAAILGQIADIRATEALITAARTGKKLVRQAAARSLGQIRSESAIPVLIEKLQDGDEDMDVRSHAALGLLYFVKAGNREIEALLGRDEYREPVIGAAAIHIVEQTFGN